MWRKPGESWILCSKNPLPCTNMIRTPGDRMRPTGSWRRLGPGRTLSSPADRHDSWFPIHDSEGVWFLRLRGRRPSAAPCFVELDDRHAVEASRGGQRTFRIEAIPLRYQDV